jgi:hypothetical protein
MADVPQFGEGFWVTETLLVMAAALFGISMFAPESKAVDLIVGGLIGILGSLGSFWFQSRGQTSGKIEP